jgi:hypothetical protein
MKMAEIELLGLLALTTAIGSSCAAEQSDTRQRSSEPPVAETTPASPDTQVERGARGARPESPAPPIPSQLGGELRPPSIPDTHAEAVRAIRGRLGRLERRFAALDHPFGIPLDGEDRPLVALRAEARRDVEHLEGAPSDDWRLAYLEAWRSLDDYQSSLTRLAKEEGMRPARVTTQPDTVAPRPPEE